MADTVWYRSLYWRIAGGFVLLVAALLGVQVLVFLWLTGRTAELWPGRTPAELAQAIAGDLAEALTDQPALDIEAHLQVHHATSYRPWAVALTDGRLVLSRHAGETPALGRAARVRLGGATGTGRRGGRRGAPPGPPPLDNFAFAAVLVADVTVGMVAVPLGAPPLSAAILDFGATLAAIAFALLVIGTTVAALMIFRPAHHRLRALEQAARELGAGRPHARAADDGGDEVASLAHSFNEMAASLEARSGALAEADRTRRRLLADVSHELMTPLSAIRGYVETLTMGDVALDPATRQRYLQVVADEAQRLEHIVGDLLDLARLEGGGTVLRREPVAIDQLLARLEQRHERVLQEKGIALETRADADLPAVIGDPYRLEQALQNLVANAVRHTPPSGQISVDVSAADGGTRIRVVDTGPGIPPEHLQHVFERFYKVDSSRAGTDVPSGSGLGLSIVRAIVAGHGGRVTADNAPGGGARFEIHLP